MSGALWPDPAQRLVQPSLLPDPRDLVARYLERHWTEASCHGQDLLCAQAIVYLRAHRALPPDIARLLDAELPPLSRREPRR